MCVCMAGSRTLGVLTVWLLTSAAGSQYCQRGAEKLSFHDINQQVSLETLSTAGSLGPLYGFVHQFLDAVQPNPFPDDLIRDALNNVWDVGKVMRYLAGYTVCAIIAVLYVLVVPLVGLVFCCCRCHGKCGGRVQQDLKCQHGAMATCSGATTIIILAGVVLAFTANSRVTESAQTSGTSLCSSVGNVADFLTSVSQNMQNIVNQFSVANNTFQNELKDEDDLYGNAIVSSLQSSVQRTLNDLSISIKDAANATELLQIINQISASLQSRQAALQSSLTERRDALLGISEYNRSLASDLDGLQIDADFSKIPSVEEELAYMKRNNLSDLIEKGNKTFYDIPQTIRNQGKSMVDDILAALGAHGNTLMAFNQHLTELQILSNEISSVKKPIEQYGKQAQRYDFYRWAVALALCCLILLVVVLNILGLVLGSTGVHLRQHTDDDSVLAASGARLLMAGVGISFIFSWLFMLVVLVTFLVGGNIYTMGCRNWRNKEILLFLDNPRNLPEYLNISKLGMNFSISEVYNACEEGKSLYYSMHLDQFGFDFEVDKYVSKLNSIISGLSVNLTGVRLLSKKDKMRIFYLKNSHIAHINYTLMRTQLDKKVVQIDLLGYADRLSSAAQLQNDPSIRDKFEVEAMSIRELYNTTVRQQEADAQSMNASVAALSSISQTFKSTVDRALQSLSTTQTQIFTEGPLIVKNVTQCVVDQAINNLKQYLTWTKQTIITKVLSCLPLAVALDNVYTTVCVNTVDPWNAYWLCLGWCTVFLIPSAIFAVRTAKHFRPILRRPGDPFNTDNTFRIPKAKLRNPSVYANSNQNNGSNYNINLSQ